MPKYLADNRIVAVMFLALTFVNADPISHGYSSARCMQGGVLTPAPLLDIVSKL